MTINLDKIGIFKKMKIYTIEIAFLKLEINKIIIDIKVTVI